MNTQSLERPLAKRPGRFHEQPAEQSCGAPPVADRIAVQCLVRDDPFTPTIPSQTTTEPKEGAPAVTSGSTNGTAVAGKASVPPAIECGPVPEKEKRRKKKKRREPTSYSALAESGDVDGLLQVLQHSELGRHLLPDGLDQLQRAIEVACQKDPARFSQAMFRRMVSFSTYLVVRSQLLTSMALDRRNHAGNYPHEGRLLNETREAITPELLALQRHMAELLELQVHTSRLWEIVAEKKQRRTRKTLRLPATCEPEGNDTNPGSPGCALADETPAQEQDRRHAQQE